MRLLLLRLMLVLLLLLLRLLLLLLIRLLLLLLLCLCLLMRLPLQPRVASHSCHDLAGVQQQSTGAAQLLKCMSGHIFCKYQAMT
jgi:hypothetical protein